MYEFNYPTLVTALHFVFTSVGLFFMEKAGLFTHKAITTMQVLPLAASYALCVPLSNLSLAYNSVGFYQMMKILTTPYVAIIETYFYGASFESQVKVSLVVVVIGVVMATVNDFEVNLIGTVYATACMIITAQYQIYVGTKQKEFGLNSTQVCDPLVRDSAVVAQHDARLRRHHVPRHAVL